MVLNLCHDRQNECTQRRLRDHDRTCLRLINEVGSLPTNVPRIALIGRMLDVELESDFEILCAVYRHLQMLRHPNFPNVYFTHLYKDQVRRQPGYMDACPDNQQCQVSFIPTITPCLGIDLVSEAELMGFGFYTTPQPSTSPDMHSRAIPTREVKFVMY
ncbi:hypothetical protein F4776DRAFT_422738 [Hypoxylon sp. NC0597]|nr:hypothetical protein F4776DRAFT_422738 [Hypoxylon sp. NC0597]